MKPRPVFRFATPRPSLTLPAAMKTVTLGALFTSAALLVIAALDVGCSRNNIEAVNLANEGDKAKATDIDTAVSKYEQATNLDPTNHRILWKLGQAYLKKEQWDKVATTMAKAEKVEPKHANFHYLHGMALARQAVKGPATWADAKGPLEESLKLDPNGPNYPTGAGWDSKNAGATHFELAEVLFHMDDEKGALDEYTKAIQVKPDEISFYGPLADLYIHLNLVKEAEDVLNSAVSFAKDGDKQLFNVHSLLGQVADMKGDAAKASTEYELAKKACGQCNEGGQQIAFFNLGAAYATLKPPRKSEAMAQLQSFQKMICKGAAAARYADQCTQAQQLASRLGGTLQ